MAAYGWRGAGKRARLAGRACLSRTRSGDRLAHLRETGAKPLVGCILVQSRMPYGNDVEPRNVDRWGKDCKVGAARMQQPRRHQSDQVVGLEDVRDQEKARDRIAHLPL